MVRRDLCSHAYAALLGPADLLGAAGGADVRDMDMSASQLGERDIARDDRLLGGRGVAGEAQPRRHPTLVDAEPADDGVVLAVVHDGQAELARVQQRHLHQAPRGDGTAVVGESDYPGPGHFLHVGELEPFAAAGDGAKGEDADRPRRARLARDEVDDGRVVDGRAGVGHTAEGREPAPRACGCPRGDGLFVLEPGLAQVRVQIDETGRDYQPARVYHRGAVRRGHPPARNNPPVADEEVGFSVGPVDRVDEAAASKQGVNAHGVPAPDAPVSRR